MARGNFTVKGRMLAALLAIVALNLAFVTVVTWLYLVVLPTVVAGSYLYLVDGTAPAVWELARLPLEAPWLLAVTAAFLVGQVYYGYTRVLADVRTGTVPPDAYPTLHGVVGRLSAAADVPKPAVSVVSAENPNSFTVGRGHATTIVVTEPLLELLDEPELEAVLAHEIAHVRHRDVTLMTITGLFVAIAERTLRTARLLRRGVFDRDRVSARQRLAFDWLFPVVLFTYVVVAPVLWLFPPVARFASGELSRQREFAADRAAAELTGTPTTLARALIRVHEATPETAETDLRRERAALQALCVVPSGVVAADWYADGGDADRSGTARSVGATRRSVGDDESSAGGASTDEPTADAATPADAPSTEPSSSSTGSADSSSSTESTASSSSSTESTEPLDPTAWLGTTQSTDAPGAHTHPPIDQRIERLVGFED